MEYEDIQVLECNNIASTQYRGGNQTTPALYTNKMGRGVELKRGDKVNVEYAMINEKGCGLPQAIEVKGVNLKDERDNVIKKTFHKSVKTQIGSIPFDKQQGMTNFVFEEIELQPVEKILRDDEVNIEINYYKNLNGEGYELLPRRFNCEVQQQFPHSDPNKPISTIANKSGEIWDEPDTIATGKVHYPAGTTSYIAPLPVASKDVLSICLDDYILFFDGHDSTNYNGTQGYYKLATDGSRFTILARDKTIFYPMTYDGVNYLSMYNQIPKYEHIGDYHIYTELLELKVDKGFNSPEYIARQLTEQLQEAQPPTDVARDDEGISPHYHQFSKTTDTATYKAFNCAWNGGHKEENFNDFDDVAPGGDEAINGVNYLACYEYIGCKRPELFIEGRKINTWNETNLFIQNTIVGAPDNTTEPIVTSWEWESDELVEPFLQKMSALFKEQYKYPELFEGNDDFFGVSDTPLKNRETCRFLHINRYNNVTGDIENYLGYDDMFDKGATRKSMPVFFKFDSVYLDVMTNGLDVQELAYGFATKTLMADGKYYITLHPELVGGLPEYIFSFQDATQILGGETLIGWDWHFSAYSTACCLLYSGYQKFSHDGLFSYGDENLDYDLSKGDSLALWNVADYMSQTYVGSNNAQVSYTNNHFQFLNLHTAENVGQDVNAGETNASGDNPLIADAGQECYKINKRLQYWSWCPDMRPYDIDVEVINNMVKPTFSGNEPNQLTVDITYGQKLKPLNRAITPFSIMDAHCGITMNIGDSFDEDNWREGLLGILGFTYNQFNPTTIDATNNRLARIEYSNINDLKYLTTNCQVVSTDAKNYIMNRYGGIMYTTQVPVPVVMGGWGQPSHPNYIWQNYYAYGMYPTIVEQTESIQVNTQELPRTMLRAYYSIRSDLILQENNKYLGGEDSGDRLPVIAVINKENGDGDFYFASSELQFTITQDQTISSVTTSIHDPDGTLANLNAGSCVIYKISRDKTLDNGIIDEILGTQKNRLKKK